MIIRKATPEDLLSIRELEHQTETAAHWSEREYEALFSPDAPPRAVLVAADEGTRRGISGFIIARCGLEEWEIENVVVETSRRRTGLGSALVRKLLQEARLADAPAVLLEVRESNRAALQLYERVGFSEVGRRKNYYRNPSEDALVFRNSIAVP